MKSKHVLFIDYGGIIHVKNHFDLFFTVIEGKLKTIKILTSIDQYNCHCHLYNGSLKFK